MHLPLKRKSNSGTNKSILDLENDEKLRIIFFSSEQLYKEVRNGPIPAVMDWNYVKGTVEKFP